MKQWFPRFADIPGVYYQSPTGIKPERLKGYGSTPTLNAFDSGGKHYESLWWKYGEEETDASPVHEVTFGTDWSEGTNPSRLIRRCHEGLELPGEPSDYHFLLQGAAAGLSGRRREGPGILEKVEEFCYLDIQLVEAVPSILVNEYGGDPPFLQAGTFTTLIVLYEREGYLHEALEVAERAIRSHQDPVIRDRIAERLAVLESEDSE